jgi:hypothetical protein
MSDLNQRADLGVHFARLPLVTHCGHSAAVSLAAKTSPSAAFPGIDAARLSAPAHSETEYFAIEDHTTCVRD